ncbi:NACHT domain-containing protein [Cohnella faecalis]|uniref:NACHT domain-containing protein n=2 Tax=Cohnella faecalis TaxID=2315694 RepID=A0A398CX03_9BACL|nr:NACHT domain-containing protein [Cohnella faecalis]
MNEKEIKEMKASTAKLLIYGTDGQKALDSGTAVLIDPYTAITARHVLSRLTEGGRVELSFPHMPSAGSVVVRDVYRCPDELYDIAILKLDEALADGRVYPALYAVKPEGRPSYISHGFPSERSPSCTFEGKIMDIYEQFTQNDLELSVAGREGMNFSGASGSPLYMDGGVYGIIIVRDTGNTLGALSFAECRAFLAEQGIVHHSLKPLRDYERIIVERQLPMAKVGFDEGESLPYMDTYATWENVTSLDNPNRYTLGKPELLSEMVERYFAAEENGENMLFVVADFGKGKSTFLRHMAAKMAGAYRDSREIPLPVYFNLREYTKYEKFGPVLNLNKEGVIKDFLKETTGIDFANRQHPIFSQSILFLIDSLDECGSLSASDVMQVVRSVKAIVDYCRGAKIIVTTRPIPNVLGQVIKEMNDPVNQAWRFASIYGFQPDQFADYMQALHPKLPVESVHAYNRKLLDTIRSGQSIYETFNGLLNEEELKRPILAYMLYKLLEEDYELEKDSKLGIYLSFINLLTKDAKHVDDSGRKDDWLKRLGYRNLLYVTAVMWMKNLHLNGGGFLRLDDLEEALGEDASLVQFMSHSYFKNAGGIYHFNHQSFAEIIIAEYYVRLLLWSALENKTANELSPFLAIGNPTEQTVSFVKSLLNMLCDATIGDDRLDGNSLLKIRRALSPMMSSLGAAEYNRPPDDDKAGNAQRDGYLYSSYIRRVWNAEQWGGFSEISDRMLEQWPIKPEHIEKMIENAAALVNGEDDYVFFQPQRMNHSFNRDVYRIEGRKKTFDPDTERWIAMLCGTTLAERFLGESAFPPC